MALFEPDSSKLSTLKDKVVVLSGGATGIGAATVNLLARNGANVVFGDINDIEAQEVVSSAKGGNVSFEHCDVTCYKDIYSLFRAAHAKYGRIDHAISCAGIFERGKWFDQEVNIDNVSRDAGNSSTLDINVLGSAHFSRIAVVFMRDGHKQDDNRSLTLLSSANAFREAPGLYLYQTSKHAIQGFMRASRKPLYERDHIRINCVCPGMTDTPMAAGPIATFKEQGLFWQTAESVAQIILGLQTEEKMIGKAIYIEGGEGWEFEDSLYATQEQWLGKEATRRLRVNAEAVNKGALTKNK